MFPFIKNLHADKDSAYSKYMDEAIFKIPTPLVPDRVVTSQAQITVPNFKEKTIILPPIELQNQFADFVLQVDKQKSQIQKSLEKLELLKKSLMLKYFN